MTGRASAVSRIESLKKSGLSPMVTVVVVLLSSPGFYEFFFNRTDDEAVVKAEVAYEVLKERSEAQSREIEKLDREIRDLKNFMRSYVVHDPMLVSGEVEVSSSPVGISSSLSGFVASDIKPDLPDDLLEDGDGDGIPEVLEDSDLMIGKGGSLPDSLDDSSLADIISQRVSEK